MRKVIIVFSIIFGLLLPLICDADSTYSSEEPGYHFRHAKWGMSQEEVKKNENGEPDSKVSSEKNLVWKAKLLGEQVLVVYTFVFNKLIRAKYMLVKYNSVMRKRFGIPSSSQEPLVGDSITDFTKFEKALTERYGKPFKEFRNWSLVDHDPAFVEEAIRNDKAIWLSNWQTKDTTIAQVLSGKDGEISFEIGYSSKGLSRLEDEPAL